MPTIELEELKKQYKEQDTYLSDIKYLITKQELLTRKCANCERFMSEQTYMNDKWAVEFGTKTGINWNDFTEGSSKGKVSLDIAFYHTGGYCSTGASYDN